MVAIMECQEVKRVDFSQSFEIMCSRHSASNRKFPLLPVAVEETCFLVVVVVVAAASLGDSVEYALSLFAGFRIMDGEEVLY